MRLSFPFLCLVTALASAGCAPMPAVDAFPPGDPMPAPSLVPLDIILAQAAAPADIETRANTLSARAARLKARAALMRGPVHDGTTRARLAAAISAGRA